VSTMVITGDCLEVLATLDGGSIDAVVTDPPYHLTTGKKGGSGLASLNENSPAGRARATTGFMGKAWDGGQIAHDPETWRKVLRVAKPGAMLVAFGGTRTYHRLACAIEDAGWELRDSIGVAHEPGDFGDCPWLLVWTFAVGFPKSLNLDGGLGTALKPAWEPIVLARKPLEGTVASNVIKHGTGALRIDECRIATAEDITTHSRGDGYEGQSFNRMNPKPARKQPGQDIGRWPANLLHDGSPEVVEMFPQSDGQCGKLEDQDHDSPTVSCYGDMPPRQAFPLRGDSGSAARFFFAAEPDPLCALCGLLDTDECGSVSAKKEGETCSPVKNAVPSSPSEGGRKLSDSVPVAVPQSQQQNCEARAERLSANASHAEPDSTVSHAKTGSTVPQNVPASELESLARVVRSAGNLCGLCATAIAQGLVEARLRQDPVSLRGLVSISEQSRQTLARCLVSFAGLLGDTDTIPTTDSLSLFFGSAFHAIESCMERTRGRTGTGICLPRFHFSGKATRLDREQGLEAFVPKQRDDGREAEAPGANNPCNRGGEARKNHHPTVKPTALMRWLVRLITPPGGTVLDPFAGSGSTGKACVFERLNFLGIERESDYADIARARIAWAEAHLEPEQLALLGMP